MALKVLSGVISPKSENAGEATVTFNPHAVSGDASGSHLHMVGATGDFIDMPCHMIALKNVVFHEQCNSGDPAYAGTDNFRDIWALLDHVSITHEELKVKWICSQMTKVKDISYIIIGEVAEKEVPEEEKPPTRP